MAPRTTTWAWLPITAQHSALARFARARSVPGLGDGYLYAFTVADPPPGYVGPVPLCICTGRRRGSRG